MTLIKKLAAAVLALALVMTCSVGTLACTSIYVGSDLTRDGGVYFARSEDISNSYNKVFYVSPAGNHKAGDVYSGCYGFEYTFEKDSFSYTAFRDDDLSGVCPDCGGGHRHTPYEAGGTNEMGVSMTATVSIYPNEDMDAADPYVDTGIEEAEIVTVILGQASTAREGLDILLGIYDEYGMCGGSSILIGDQNEVWYVENCSGTQYVAMRLPQDMILVNPNMSLVGLIDLDDEEIIASEGLIQTAVDAGTFVGDRAENQIDYRASYSEDHIDPRMKNCLAYVNRSYASADEALEDSDFCISNVKDDQTVPLYTNIRANRTFTTQDMVDFYKTDLVARDANLDIHIFQLYADAVPELGTVEWVAMDDGAYTVAVPYYPILTTDTYAGYQIGTAPAQFVTEKPDGAQPCYPDTSQDGEKGFTVLPEDWADSMYWSFDAVSNYVLYVDDSRQKTVKDAYDDLQDSFYDQFRKLARDAARAEDLQALSATVTAASADMARQAHETAVSLYRDMSGK